jgi:hypothetical protein
MIRRNIPSRVPRTPPGGATRVFTPRQDVTVEDDADDTPAEETKPTTDARKARRKRGRGPFSAALAAALLIPGLGAQDMPADPLVGAALNLELHHGKKRTKASRVEQRLAPTVRVALNDWAAVIQAHDLAVAVPQDANAVLLGTVSDDELSRLARELDETFELFEELLPADHDASHDPAVVAFVFDEPGLHGEPLAAVLEQLVERKVLDRGSADRLLERPGGMAMRHASMFIQPGYDMAGDASAGDDEFRLANATVHQTVQALVTRRFGQLPKPVLWGLGFVAEQRQFESIYHFNAHGFVKASDHFEWPDKARDVVEDERVLGSDAWLDAAESGRLTASQLLAWAQLDELLHEDAEVLAGMLTHFGESHEEHRPFGGSSQWHGDEDEARALLSEHVDARSAKALRKHLKRLR